MKPTKEEITHLKKLLAPQCTLVLRDEVMERFLSMGEMIHLSRGENFIEIGDVDDGVYVVFDGIIRAWHWHDDREITPSFADSGTYFFSCNPFVIGQGSFYNYEACCQTTLIRVPKKAFDAMAEDCHEFALWALAMAHSQILFFERKSTVFSGTAKEKYEAMIKVRPEIMQKVPLNVIATYLGISPQHLSRLRKELY